MNQTYIPGVLTRLVGWLVGWLAGWLASWLVGRSAQISACSAVLAQHSVRLNGID